MKSSAKQIIELSRILEALDQEESLSFIEVPDQAGYVQKRGCKKCLDEIVGKLTRQDEAGQEKRQG